MCDNILLYYLDQSPPTSLSSSSIGCRPVMISFFYWHQACFLFYWTLGMLPKLYNCPQLLRTTFTQIQNVSLKHNLKRIIQNFETHHCAYTYIIMTPSILAIIVLVLFLSRWLHNINHKQYHPKPLTSFLYLFCVNTQHLSLGSKPCLPEHGCTEIMLLKVTKKKPMWTNCTIPHVRLSGVFPTSSQSLLELCDSTQLSGRHDYV